MDVTSRRLDLLKFEGLGLCRVEIVRQLSKKFECSERAVYNDFETRAKWQPSLLSAAKTEDAFLKVVNRLEQIYSLAGKNAVRASNPCVQMSALNLMLKANSMNLESSIVREMMSKLKALEEKFENEFKKEK
jgi:hypothetical protein